MNLQNYLNSDKQINLMSSPYRFGVIYNFFKPDIYEQLTVAYRKWMENARPLGAVGEHDLYYGALCATPSEQDMLSGVQQVLISKQLQAYLCGFFLPPSQAHHVNQFIILGAHQHNPPTETSWVHADFNIVSFVEKKVANENCLMMWEPTDCNYTEDSLNDQPNTVKVARYIACIYYLDNAPWQLGDGGETGIYNGFEKDLPLAGKIAPINNCLFFFEITPFSFHCAQGCTRQRNSLIWWYHTSPAYQYFKNKDLIEFKRNFIENAEDFEWWTKPEKDKWAIELDPLYEYYKAYQYG